ncbi:alpha/beta hydrolase [Rossellomorea marisflavi]|uniref:alpha/beta hydrolase n=1 Tax=Rossellomorea marisflavi TaxID=189381 RepID=UPI0011E79840|nr:alpha/beta hydrolase [Rossellomorea marisflavi]TYO72698.1 alpha/beta hydrolase [Rossellomorea marisflavi]
MSSKSKRVYIWSIALCFVFLIAYILFESQDVESSEQPLTAEQQYPTVFVHGYKGTYNSFKTMLERFQDDHGWGQKVLEIYVRQDGSVEHDGDIPSDPSSTPFVQVIFEDNRASLEKQAIWLENAMKFLHHEYGVENINIVSHSMGGLASTVYLEQTSENPFVPKTERFITIATPFQGVTKSSYDQINTGAAVIDLKPESGALQKMYQDAHQLPEGLKMLSIGGSGDGVVNTQSATFSKEIFANQDVQTTIVYDNRITHSGMHETLKVDKLVGEFLWDQ